MIKSSTLPFSLSGVALLVACAAASAADVSAGRALSEGCAACHGAERRFPNSAHTVACRPADEFVQWQLVYFRSGARNSDVMGTIAQALSNGDIRNLGASYASLPPPKPAAGFDELAQNGEKLAVLHRCKSCHADDYNGFRAAARLSGQREDVLVQALRDFK